jgi:hypothetical protein
LNSFFKYTLKLGYKKTARDRPNLYVKIGVR